MARSFRTLGLDPATADRKAVRAAYARLVRETRPEDDPERFQRLREARDVALDLLARRGGGGGGNAAPRSPTAMADARPAEVATAIDAPPHGARPDIPYEPVRLSARSVVPDAAPEPDPIPASAETITVDRAEEAAPREVVPTGLFDDWSRERGGAPRDERDETPQPAGERVVEVSADEAPTAAATDAPDLAADAMPPLSRLAIAVAEAAAAPFDPGPWDRVERAVGGLGLSETAAGETLLGRPLRNLAGAVIREPQALPVETARTVARLAEHLGWTRANGLFDRLSRDETRALLFVVTARAADRPGGHRSGGIERDARGIPTIASERLRPWLGTRADRYLDALARAQARGRWPWRLSISALFLGLAWAARRRAVGAYVVLLSLYVLAVCVFGTLMEIEGMDDWAGRTILAGYFLPNLWVALSADRYAVESAVRRAHDPFAEPVGPRSVLWSLVIAYCAMKAVLMVGVIAAVELQPLVEPWFVR